MGFCLHSKQLQRVEREQEKKRLHAQLIYAKSDFIFVQLTRILLFHCSVAKATRTHNIEIDTSTPKITARTNSFVFAASYVRSHFLLSLRWQFFDY